MLCYGRPLHVVCDGCKVAYSAGLGKVDKGYKGSTDNRTKNGTGKRIRFIRKWYESSVVIDLKFEYAVDTVQESKRLKGFTLNSNIDT